MFSFFETRQDKFVTTLTRQREKLSKVTRTKKRGWYTKEKMRTKLGWSKYLDCFLKHGAMPWSLHQYIPPFLQKYGPVYVTQHTCSHHLFNPARSVLSCFPRKYIDDVVKYCEKKGNESLIRFLGHIESAIISAYSLAKHVQRTNIMHMACQNMPKERSHM